MPATTPPKARIPLQSAAQKALQYCKELFSKGGSNFMLEEVEYSEKDAAWLITIGFDVEPAKTPLDALVGFKGARFVRQYKKVKIHSQTGEPLSVHIRKLD